ncbi:transport protein particle component, Bet3 family protein [Saccharata proteae CBS 121410]|uniref:Transport protein particle component, Bet3 family protein n=1 Tax=Saccharata proteae CBS 121410 TaxID=1314787 RepID=A0A9P4LYD1_9PEZI|nr:transport protein particle component, Bet3 family protein [Saccharata proteae CBS 121410]
MSFVEPQPPPNVSDPSATYVSSSCLDFLFIELVPMAYRIASELAAREDEWSRGSGTAADEEEMREAVFYKLENLGFRVGLGVCERFSRDKPRFNDTLDVIKFICKDLWTIVFRKQIDNLKTNHRGIYVLTDNNFKPLKSMSLEKGVDGTLDRAQPFLFFPAGLIRGALSSLGISATVQAETLALPGATFQIRTSGAKT